MKRHVTIGVFAILFAFSILAVFFGVLSTPAMAINTDVIFGELELQTLDGIQIGSYAWGEFSKGETKRLDCKLVYYGEFPTRVSWNTTELSSDWDMKILHYTQLKQKIWQTQKSITLIPGKETQIIIVLTEKSATPNREYTFNLNFISLYKSAAITD